MAGLDTAADLSRRRKGDKGKMDITRRVRKETTMTLAWIAQRLQMGVWTHVSNLLRAKERTGAETARKRTSVKSED